MLRKDWAAPLMVLLPAIAVTFAAPPARATSRAPQLHMHVGPGVNATISAPDMRISCSDDAQCSFEVPANSSFDIVARAAPGHDFHWSGCAPQPGADRCRVEIRQDAVLVTVR